MTSAAAQITLEFEKLKATAEALAQRAAALKDKSALRQLDLVWHRLEQGPIRLLVLGVTSSGKSTLINALAGDVVVPEGNTATSPLPVWLKRGNVNLDLFDRSASPFPAREPIGLFAFITQFCYSALEKDSSLYTAYSAAECCRETIHPDLECVTLIDTPGLKASSGDDARAEECTELGCEMVILLCSAENGTGALSDQDGKYYKALFEKLNLPLPDSLFVVGNVRDEAYSGFGAEAGFGKVARLHFGKYTQLFRFDVRAARIKRAGPYRYGDLLPEQVKNDEERDNAGTRQAMEMNLWKESRGEGEGLWITNYDEATQELDKLCAAVHERTRQLLEDPEALIQPVREELQQIALRLLKQDVQNPILTQKHPEALKLTQFRTVIKTHLADYKQDLAAHARTAQENKDNSPQVLKQLQSRSDFFRVFSDVSGAQADADMVAALSGDDWEDLHTAYTERYVVYTQAKAESLFSVGSQARTLHGGIKDRLNQLATHLKKLDRTYKELTVPGTDPDRFTALTNAAHSELDKLRDRVNKAFDSARDNTLGAFNEYRFDLVLSAELKVRRAALVKRKFGSRFFLYPNVENVAHTLYEKQAAEAVKMSTEYYDAVASLLEDKSRFKALDALLEHIEDLITATNQRLVRIHYNELLGEDLALQTDEGGTPSC